MIKAIKENILQTLKLDNLPPAKQQEVLQRMTDIINERVMNRLWRELTPEQHKQLTPLLEAGNDQAISDFINKNFPNLTTLVSEEVEKYKQETTDLLSELKF